MQDYLVSHPDFAAAIAGAVFAFLTFTVKAVYNGYRLRLIARATDKETQDKIASIPPLSMFLILALTAAMLTAAITVYHVGHEAWVLFARECRNDDDCPKSSRCERGYCTSTAIGSAEVVSKPISLLYIPRHDQYQSLTNRDLE